MRAMEAAAPVCKDRIGLVEFEEDREKERFERSDELVQVVKAELLRQPGVRVVFFASGQVAEDAAADLRKLKEFKGAVQFYKHDSPSSCLLYGSRTPRQSAPREETVAPAQRDQVYNVPELKYGVTGPVQSTLDHKMAPWLESRPTRIRKGTRKITDMFGRK